MSDVKIQQAGLSGMMMPILDPNDPNPLGLGTVKDDLPRQVFARHMQEARASIPYKIPQPHGIFMDGLNAGVELTLDVIQLHGYKLLDPVGNVVNHAHSLACGIWYKEPE